MAKRRDSDKPPVPVTPMGKVYPKLKPVIEETQVAFKDSDGYVHHTMSHFDYHSILEYLDKKAK